MQVVEFADVTGPLEFQYDEEWLGVLQSTHHLMSLNRQQTPLPGKHTPHISTLFDGCRQAFHSCMQTDIPIQRSITTVSLML